METLFTSTLTVALAEMGDKTQLLSLLLAARFRNKAGIIAGILVATLLNHAASAWFGTWLSQFLFGTTGKVVLSLSFILLAFWLLVPDKEDDDAIKYAKYGAFIVSLVLFFLAEIGDKTQVATVALASTYNSIFWVTMGSTLGMLIANVPVVYAGEKLMTKIPFNYARIAAAVVFILVGLSILFT